MHNLAAKFGIFFDICKKFSKDLVDERGNLPRRGVVPRFSDLEVIALSLTAEQCSIDSELLLFSIWRNTRLTFQTSFLVANSMTVVSSYLRFASNDSIKTYTANLCEQIRKNIAQAIDAGEDIFIVDSKPIPVCRIARAKRCKLGKTDYATAPSFGYCAAQNCYYYGYKFHALCGISGVIHSFDMSKASVHDIHYLKDIQYNYHHCTSLGDKGYLSASVQLDLFETA